MSKWEGIATKKIALWIALMFLIPSAAFADEIEIEGFTHDSVVFTFSNARFVTYEGIDSLSVDVEAEVRTSFLSRTIDFGDIRLAMYDPNVEKRITVTPSLLNSSTFGTIIRLTSVDGKKIKQRSDIGENAVRSIEVESGKIHKGTLLFPLRQPYTMITSLEYKGVRGAVRKSRNEYIDLGLEDLNSVSVLNHLKATVIPTEGDMILLSILGQMRDFERINEPLKGAW